MCSAFLQGFLLNLNYFFFFYEYTGKQILLTPIVVLLITCGVSLLTSCDENICLFFLTESETVICYSTH